MAPATITTNQGATEEPTSPESEYGACSSSSSSSSSNSNSNDENENFDNAIDDEPSAEQPKKVLVKRAPWMIALGFFFFYYIFWFVLVIVGRYWRREGWEEALPGLGKTALRKFTIRNHMTFGGIAILCSPIQMITPFTSAWKKRGVNWYRRLHRYSGRVYVACAILSFIFGQWFICLKEFALVGGYNMGVAFSFAGIAIAYFAYMTWKTAPSRNPDGIYTVEDHRNYAIRSFGQIIAPILYRYWYTLLMILNVYQTPPMNKGNEAGDDLVCDDRDVCPDYERPFDAIYCWLYWISAWVVSEIIILYLPKHQKQQITETAEVNPMEALLLTTTSESGETNSSESTGRVEGTDDANNKSSALIVNSVGWVLAVLTLMVSGPIMMGLVDRLIKSI